MSADQFIEQNKQYILNVDGCLTGDANITLMGKNGKMVFYYFEDGKLAKELERQAAASERAAKAAEAHERGMVKQHMQALKMNDAFDKHAKGLDEVSRRGNVYVNTLRSMATAALAYVGVNFFTNIVKQADAWSMMQSKLSLAVGGMEVAVNVQHSLFEMAQRLRVPLEDSVKLFTRMAVPLQKMGLGVKDTQTVVESFSTALKLAGATGQEASSAMLQFSQSINAGRLNGGEFNSIAEASPNVLRAIEAELIRTGRGAELTAKGLKEMAAAGKLTTDVLVNALKNAAPQWKKDFDSLPLTVDGALQRIKNSWLKIIGDLGKDTKFNEKMADAVKKLEALMPPLAEAIVTTFTLIVDHGAKVVTALTSILGVMALFKAAVFIQPFLNAAIAAGTLAGALGQVKLAMLALGITPVGLALTALAGTVAAVAYNWDSLTKSVSKVNDVNNQTLTTSGEIVKGIHSENTALEAQIDKLRRANGEQEKYNSTKLEGINAGTQADLEQLNRGLKVLERNLADAEKAAKSAYKLSGFDPSKIAKISKANDDVAETKSAIESQQREIILATANLEKMKRLTAERDEKQREKEVRDRVTTIYENARTERQIVEDDFKKRRDIAKEAYEKLKYDKMYYLQELANIDREYKEAIKKTDKPETSTKDLTPEITNLDRINELLAEQVQLNKEWQESDSKKLASGEKFKLNVLAENEAIMKLLASGKIEEKLMTDKQRKQLLTTLSVNDEAIARSKVVSALQKGRELAQADSKRIEQAGEELANEEAKLEVLMRQLNIGEETNIAKQQQSVIEAEIALSGLIQTEKFGVELVQAQKLLKVRQDTLAAMQGIEAKDRSKELADKYEQDYQAANKKIADGLYSAIGKGGENAVKKLIQDMKSWFARLVLSPIINPISQMGASIIAPNAASAQGGITSITDMGSNIYKSITGGFSAATTSLATSIGEIGASMGSEFMLSVSSMMQGGAASGLAGATASALTMMPYVAAAVAAFQGVKAINGDYRLGGLSADAGALLGVMPRLFGMKEKQFADQTVTGNLGTNNLSRNQAWTQQGGLFRSDRADTWKYMLNNSTATTSDGKSYQDTASLESDKALLNQLTNMYSAVKVASTEYAKALGLNAESIAARTDAINFTFGKTADETSANITKAFDAITNSIASDLLGNLKQLALQNETSAQTMGRLAANITSTNGMFKALGYNLFKLDVEGIKAADAIVTLFGGLDKFQSVASSYYDNFYLDAEKSQFKIDAMTKSLKELGKELPASRAAFREMVEAAQKAGDNELYVALMKLSSGFAEITEAATTASKELPQKMKDMFDKLSKDTDRWYNLRSQASSLKESVSSAMGNPQKDPAIRIKQLWDAMATDVSPEQKMQLAGELKDLVLAKYQVEKDSMQKLIDFGKQLRSYVESLKLGTLSPMTAGQKLAEAKRQYDETLAKAQGGDTTAQGNLQGKAESYLQLAQTAFASSSEYVGIFNSVTGSLDSLGLESLTAAEVAQNTANSQLLELQKLYEFATTVETTANNYYNASVLELTKQTLIMDATYKQLGVLNGMTEVLSTLPAEIAAAVSGGLFVTKLYETLAGKTGKEIDTTGMEYWLKEVGLYGREYVLKAFQDAVAKAPITSPIVAIKPTDTTTVLQETVVALKEEIAALRDDQNKQTAALINATVIANQQNASSNG